MKWAPKHDPRACQSPSPTLALHNNLVRSRFSIPTTNSSATVRELQSAESTLYHWTDNKTILKITRRVDLRTCLVVVIHKGSSSSTVTVTSVKSKKNVCKHLFYFTISSSSTLATQIHHIGSPFDAHPVTTLIASVLNTSNSKAIPQQSKLRYSLTVPSHHSHNLE